MLKQYVLQNRFSFFFYFGIMGSNNNAFMSQRVDVHTYLKIKTI